MIVYLVRHARAGSRKDWVGDDRLRPLDERGVRQAEALVSQLADREFSRIVSSPYVRCVETVVPLGRARGFDVEETEALAEAAGAGPALELFRGAEAALVACVHGDLVEALLGEKAKKGSTAILEVDASVTLVELLQPQA